MAYLHARSNVCRSGVTYAGLALRTFGVSIGGVARTDVQQNVNFSLSKTLDGDQALTLTLGGAEPSEGQDVLLTLGGELLFGGTVSRVRSIMVGPQLVKWECVCTDWWWLLNRYARVTGTFSGGVNTVVARLLATYTDGGFLPGYLPQSLGNISITCDDEPLADVLRRVAKGANSGAGAFLRLTPFKRIDMATSFPDGLALTLVNATNYQTISREKALDQIRTRVRARGKATQTTALVQFFAAGTIPVAEVGIFADSGSVWVAGMGPVAYTGRTAASGPGSLTGCTGVTDDIAQGTAVQVYVESNDAAAQTALATKLGGGRSGIATHSLSNEDWSLAEATAMAGAHLTLLKDTQQAVNITGVAVPAAKMLQHEVGAIIAASATTPMTVSGDFRIQQVTVSAFSSMAETEPAFNVVAVARSTVGVNLFDLLGILS